MTQTLGYNHNAKFSCVAFAYISANTAVIYAHVDLLQDSIKGN